MDTQFLTDLGDYQARPVIIDRVSDDVVYYGYCLPNCKGVNDAKWLIQKWVRNDTIEQIGYPFGLREYSFKWEDRFAYDYKITPHLDFFTA